MEQVSGIYAITHPPSGRSYIGSSKDIAKRLANHQKYLRLGTHANSYLQQAYNKYGKHQFHFSSLEFCDESVLIEREQFWIDQVQAAKKSFGFNLSKLASGGSPGEEGRRSIAESNRRRAGIKKVVHDRETWIAKLSASHKAKEKKLSKSHKDALVASHIGKPWKASDTEAWKAKISASRTGKKYGKRNPEVGMKISASLTGLPHSESRKKNISKAIMALPQETRSLRAFKAWETKRAKKEVASGK